MRHKETPLKEFADLPSGIIAVNTYLVNHNYKSIKNKYLEFLGQHEGTRTDLISRVEMIFLMNRVKIKRRRFITLQKPRPLKDIPLSPFKDYMLKLENDYWLYMEHNAYYSYYDMREVIVLEFCEIKSKMRKKQGAKKKRLDL